jgi:hypothetical protein
MKTVLDILRRAGGWHPGLYLKITNPPYLELVIEAVDESGPMGLPAISVAHYGQQNGDLMRDPEMCFELVGEDRLDPTTGATITWRSNSGAATSSATATCVSGSCMSSISTSRRLGTTTFAHRVLPRSSPTNASLVSPLSLGADIQTVPLFVLPPLTLGKEHCIHGNHRHQCH